MTYPRATPGHVFCLLVLGLALSPGAGCGASVDRETYAAGEPGSSLFANGSSLTAWLDGCAPFHFEQRVDGEWTDRGLPLACFWNGMTIPVAGGQSVALDFDAPADSGLWRLSFEVGAGCGEAATPGTCGVSRIPTEPFAVEREPCPPDTFECQFFPAAPNVLCPDGVNSSGPSSVCTRDPETGVCGYEFLVCP